MKAYDRKAQDKKNRAFVLKEARFLLELSDLVSLNTMHDTEGFGRTRMEQFYRGFQDTYDGYKSRYLAWDDSVICGDRTDTEMLKRHLRQIGYEYTAPVYKPCPPIIRQSADRERLLLIEKYDIVMRETIPVMEHAELVTLITMHDLFGRGRERLERYFTRYRTTYDAFRALYLTADESIRVVSDNQKKRLLGIGLDYDALVEDILDGYRNGGRK